VWNSTHILRKRRKRTRRVVRREIKTSSLRSKNPNNRSNNRLKKCPNNPRKKPRQRILQKLNQPRQHNRLLKIDGLRIIVDVVYIVNYAGINFLCWTSEEVNSLKKIKQYDGALTKLKHSIFNLN
jgi:hypothetical protein